MIQKAGLTYAIEYRGKHICIHVEANGRRLPFFAAASPSDQRAVKNFVGDVRRGLRQAGVQI
jgi:hypothetical protein